ncbi:Alpha-galactosidase Mel36A (plasmid) [Asticcacaulis sp. MM231]
MHVTDQVWPTDNTDPFDRLKMQDGFSHAYMPGVMMAWVTASPNWVNKRATSLEYRFLSAMQGCLGIGDNLNHWGPEDFATAKRLVAEYKSIRQTVQRGDLYRLISPQGGAERSATLTVSEAKRQAVLFTFLHSSSTFDATPLIQLQGLDPQARYAVRSLVGAMEADTPKIASGSYWMHHGVRIPLKGDFQAAALVLDVV